MKIEKFEETLQKDLAWRKKEVSDLWLLCQEKNIEVILKSFLLILYAHWEGFIKQSSKSYLIFISENKLKHKELALNFKAITLKGVINNCIKDNDSLSLVNEVQLLNKIMAKEEAKFSVPNNILNEKNKSFINTQSNLTPKIFRGFCDTLGIEYKDCLKIREHYLNEQLINNRNAIGHGSQLDLSSINDFDLTLESLARLKEIIFAIIDSFKDDLLEYATEQYYLAEKVENKRAYDEQASKKLEKTFKDIEDRYSL
ncbi:MAG: MAE_28990/MAE_18760 family HEPN-like nuclease [Crocosphaera sp.]|nr:MAE_28990/MAE_18760 family HEPN-like nuclease [Crocosphaera sp.]